MSLGQTKAPVGNTDNDSKLMIYNIYTWNRHDPFLE